MKYNLLIIFLLFVSCINKTPQPTIADKVLALYPSIQVDTLAVTSAVDDYDAPSYPFKGIPIDSSLLAFFPKNIRELANYDPHFFACYQFKLDSNHTGLITRVPGEYAPSTVLLLIYNTQTNQVIQQQKLSDSWGDNGESATWDSWIYKNKNGEIQCFYWRQDCAYPTEDSQTPECSDSLAMYRIEQGLLKGVPSSDASLEQAKLWFSR